MEKVSNVSPYLKVKLCRQRRVQQQGLGVHHDFLDPVLDGVFAPAQVLKQSSIVAEADGEAVLARHVNATAALTESVLFQSRICVLDPAAINYQ